MPKRMFLAVLGAAILLVSIYPVRAQAPQTLDAALLDGEIAAVRSEMDTATARLAALEARYGELPWSRDRTDDFVVLGREVDDLRERVVALGARLAALNAANKSAAAVVSIAPLRASLDDYGGPPIPSTVAEGAVLSFETTVRHAASDIPQIANLSWQVFSKAGAPVTALVKREQVAESGTTKPYRFQFRLSGLPNGPYRVVFTHAPATGDAAPISVESGFTVSQSVRITRAVVSPDTKAEKHSSVLYPDEFPHMYVYFDAGDSKSVKVDFTVRSARDGTERHRQQVERPIKPGEAETRVGIRIQPGRVREGEDAVFVATLTGPDGFVVTRETKFSVQAYTATLNLPSQLKSLDPVTFSIGVPAQFSQPLQIQLSPHNATASLTGGNTGILSAAANQYGGSGNLNVTVTDAQGRVARGSAYFTITPPPAVAAAPPPMPQPSQGGRVQALQTPKPSVAPAPPAPPAPAGPNLDDAIRDFQRQMAQIQADKQAAELRSQQERAKGMQDLQRQLQQLNQRPAPAQQAQAGASCTPATDGMYRVKFVGRGGDGMYRADVSPSATSRLAGPIVPSGLCSGGYMNSGSRDNVLRHLRQGGNIEIIDPSRCPLRVICRQ
jgi:hypothetical protein